MRSELNDFVYFAEVVGHGGFAAAGRALREPKSKLSRRVAGLEARLGVRLIEERIDLALRVRTTLDSDASLTMRTLGVSLRILVASPAVANRIADMDSLPNVPILSTTDDADEVTWSLEADDGRKTVLRFRPRLGCTDMAAVQAAAVAGLGVALLPDHVCRDALETGRLVRLLVPWAGQKGIVHLVFTTRRGLPLAVRKLIDHLAAKFPRDLVA